QPAGSFGTFRASRGLSQSCQAANSALPPQLHPLVFRAPLGVLFSPAYLALQFLLPLHSLSLNVFASRQIRLLCADIAPGSSPPLPAHPNPEAGCPAPRDQNRTP